jgi:hypothetical protein
MRTSWKRAIESPHLPVAGYLAYAAIYTITQGPSPVVAMLPSWLTYAWAFALLLGAILTFFGTIGDHNRAESAGHGFHIFGLVLYGLTAYLAVGMSGTLVIVIAAFGGVSASRLYILSRSRKAQRVATRIVREGER